MPDDRAGRDKQAQDEENRQRMRAMLEELERGDETEPPVEEAELDALDAELDAVTFPATGLELVEAVGYHEVESAEGTRDLAELLPRSEREEYDSPEAVRARVQRPTIAAAMRRIVEAADELGGVEFGSSQREGYERTFRELQAIDAVDDDEGIPVVADWVVERIREKEKLPGSRDVRRRAAKFCRSSGYEIRDDEWLGV
ncbi:hypothetical protein [Halosimplex pelagicum]|uniref:Uncharacterized protein n=1 Tax=Halosimplex pelagicum TaxID=869886 RepID=A0A7D5TDX1_9EURY|nr:hypothetical protein [Halosimplex pelagicum]QLH84233.1 hypothetical protein HZS54_22480 [Halosimplex pelagicum]